MIRVNLTTIRDNLLKISSSFSREGGKELLRLKFVKDLKSRNVDGIYHIYGKVLSDNKSKTYSTHIKVNSKNEKIIDTKCSCETFIENRRLINKYVCKHIVATTLAFYHVAKGRVCTKKRDDKSLEDRIELKLEISIKATNTKEVPSYQCEFRIGEGGTHLITSLKEFIEEEKLQLNDTFTYWKNKHKFSKEDERIIEYIKNNKANINSRFLQLTQNTLREFLELIPIGKKFNFNYEFINYEVKVKKDDLPLFLTIKSNKDSFILSHQKKFPVPLSYGGEVMFYDRYIYLPGRKQLSYYMPLYSQLKKNSEIRYEKSLPVLNNLLKEIKNITNNIVLDGVTKEFSSRLMKPNFLIYKYNGDIFCNVKVNYCGYIIDLIKDKGSNSFLRDNKKEELLDMKLGNIGFIKNERDFKFIRETEGVFELLKEGINKLREIGYVELSKDFMELKLIDHSNIISTIEDYNNFYRLKYSIGDFTIKELKTAIDFMKKGERFYKTRNSYLDLEDPGVVEFLGLVDDLCGDNNLSDEIDIDKNRSLYLQDRLRDRELSFIQGGEVFQSIVKKLLKKEFKNYSVPKALNAKLRKYQIEGFTWLSEITELGFGGILGDDMGLGKTIQIVTFLLSKKDSKSLIITPTSVIYNWKDEFARFGGSLKVGLIHGSKKQREDVIDNIDEYDVLLTTYGTLKNDEEKYKSVSFDYCIIDEGQNIKNPKAQSTLAVKKIKSRCNIALTGTPIENNLLELWSIFDFVMPGFLFTKEKFREKFILQDNIDELKSLITPFILRRLKGDVLEELPEKVEKKYLVELSPKEKGIYKSYLKEVKDKIKSSKDKISLLPYLTKLRELCLDPSLIMPDYIGVSSKRKVAKELVENSIEVGKKVLLFSQFTSLLKNIEEDLKKEDINYLYLDGSVSAKDRIDLVNEFNECDDVKVFLISLKAGGVGLNLTSASVVIHFDPWWNPAIEDQATDRAYRFGQKNMVEVIKLVAKDTIEEKIVLLQEDKKELITKLMDGKAMDGNGLKRLSSEEILKLFM